MLSTARSICKRGVTGDGSILPSQHLEDQDPEGPPVHGPAVPFALDHLRGQVLGRSAQSPGPAREQGDQSRRGDVNLMHHTMRRGVATPSPVAAWASVTAVPGRDPSQRNNSMATPGPTQRAGGKRRGSSGTRSSLSRTATHQKAPGDPNDLPLITVVADNSHKAPLRSPAR